MLDNFEKKKVVQLVHGGVLLIFERSGQAPSEQRATPLWAGTSCEIVFSNKRRDVGYWLKLS
jgi:hypothetical protein